MANSKGEKAEFLITQIALIVSWFGMIWNDLEWFGMIRNDLEWFGMIRNDLEWFGMIRNDLEWFGMIVYTLLYRKIVNRRLSNKCKIYMLEYQKNSVNSLISFHRKDEYINEENKINCFHILSKESEKG
jgi:hypothetical protein